MTKFNQQFVLNNASSKLNEDVKMLIENLLINVRLKNEGLMQVNNSIIDEFNDYYCRNKKLSEDIYLKIKALLYANLSITESIETLLNSYQEQIDIHYDELLQKEI